MDHITIRAFRASDEPSTCAMFLREHVRVLEDFGITSVTSNNATWVNDPNVVVIVAESDEVGMVGGARMHVSHDGTAQLPIERALRSLDPRIRDLVSRHGANGGIAEICGLWNANRFSGRSLPHVFVMVGITMANQLEVGAVIGLAAKYTLKYTEPLGMHTMEEVGDRGWFDYPKPGFYGIVTGVTDAYLLAAARPDMRRRMLSLRTRPRQQVVEETGTARVNIGYDLLLRRSVIDLLPYSSIERDLLRSSA